MKEAAIVRRLIEYQSPAQGRKKEQNKKRKRAVSRSRIILRIKGKFPHEQCFLR
jgi:hypothetical protein